MTLRSECVRCEKVVKNNALLRTQESIEIKAKISMAGNELQRLIFGLKHILFWELSRNLREIMTSHCVPNMEFLNLQYHFLLKQMHESSKIADVQLYRPAKGRLCTLNGGRI